MHLHIPALGQDLARANQADHLAAAGSRRLVRELTTARRAAPPDSGTSRRRVRAASARLIRRPAV